MSFRQPLVPSSLLSRPSHLRTTWFWWLLEDTPYRPASKFFRNVSSQPLNFFEALIGYQTVQLKMNFAPDEQQSSQTWLEVRASWSADSRGTHVSGLSRWLSLLHPVRSSLAYHHQASRHIAGSGGVLQEVEPSHRYMTQCARVLDFI